MTSKQNTNNGRQLKNSDDKDRGKISGWTLEKWVKGSIHMSREPLGWAIDLALLEEARKSRVQRVVIHDIESKYDYIALLSEIENHGLLINRGHVVQKVLPLDEWLWIV